jgi:hypothetical protein
MDNFNNTKYCGRCKEYKSFELFSKHSKTKDGLQWHCKFCQSQYAKEVAPIKSARDLKRYYADGRKAYLEKWYMRKYNISLSQYDDMLKKQNGVCAICKKQCSSGKRLAVDHCHSSGKIRGLLCAHCNTSLGKFNDSVELLTNAINYLKENYL